MRNNKSMWCLGLILTIVIGWILYLISPYLLLIVVGLLVLGIWWEFIKYLIKQC
jgi:uncharacterized membrane protein YhdT